MMTFEQFESFCNLPSEEGMKKLGEHYKPLLLSTLTEKDMVEIKMLFERSLNNRDNPNVKYEYLRAMMLEYTHLF